MKIGVIGAGNMGGAMIRGWINSQKIPADAIVVRGGKGETARVLQETLNFELSDDWHAFTGCDLIVVATHPDAVSSVLNELKAVLQNRSIPIVSVAYGVSVNEMQAIMGEAYPLVQVIPNTPVAFNEGVLAAVYPETMEAEVKQTIHDTLSLLGEVWETTEDTLDIFSAVAGCAPAFVDIFAEALSDGAVLHGMERAVSYRVIAQMLFGSAQLLLNAETHPAILKDAVTSPGGTTIKGVAALEKHGFRHALIAAITAIMES